MTVFKCKMCGGTIEFEPGATVGVCDSCGSKQTLPRLDDDRRANLYDRANHFRRNNEFDKAAGMYEQILSEDNTDAEAYWSLVLCRYGIEYVEDPASHKRVPTVNRAQFTSVFDDDNYKSALQYADGYQRAVYEEEAAAINEIQKGILFISQKEDPFDVFICYKETDRNGRRTRDSVLANDLYHQLTQEGFRVFFSRITLEDKLGTAYEPYIFAALNTAKVMVVLGTCKENFDAVWVKNEWSRYLSLVKESQGKKVLIPAYLDMDPYDLPDEFSHLQAQDMSKLGFMQDLIRGIKKIIKADEPETPSRETVVINSGDANIEALIRRATLSVEDGEWKKADELCEQVLNVDPENVQAYLLKLMSDLHANSKEKLADCDEPFYDNNNYKKIIRFGDNKLISELKSYNSTITLRNEQTDIQEKYKDAVSRMNLAISEKMLLEAAAIFDSISDYEDSSSNAAFCRERANQFKLEEAKRKDQEQQKAKKRVLLAIAGIAVVIVCLISFFIFRVKVLIPMQQLKEAQELIDAGKGDQALHILGQIEGNRKVEKEKNKFLCENLVSMIMKEDDGYLWENTSNSIEDYMLKLINDRKMLEKTVLLPLYKNGHVDSANYVLNNCDFREDTDSIKYEVAKLLIDADEYLYAYDLLEDIDYKDSSELVERIVPKVAEMLLKTAEIGDKVLWGSYEQDGDSSNGKESIEWRVLDKNEDSILVVSSLILDWKKFDESALFASATWEGCTLRTWLNEDFFNSSFNDQEKKRIVKSTISADELSNRNHGGMLKDTSDMIFLLNMAETGEYFSSNDDRIAKASNKNAECDGTWWTRSAGDSNAYAGFITDKGMLQFNVFLADPSPKAKDEYCGVRPAMWINVSGD